MLSCIEIYALMCLNSSAASDLGIDNYGLFVGLGYQVFIENLHRTVFSASSKYVSGIFSSSYKLFILHVVNLIHGVGLDLGLAIK